MKIFIKIAAIYMNFFTLITSVLLCTLTVFRSKKKNKTDRIHPSVLCFLSNYICSGIVMFIILRQLAMAYFVATHRASLAFDRFSSSHFTLHAV